MHRWLALVTCVAACSVDVDARERRVLDSLAEDNYVFARREPELVRMKLHKMQRGPYEWLRGTAALYWKDQMEAGGARTPTAFGSPAASRVLLVGDAHLENVGTFRASDGTMLVDWNDFDATGYGPFTGDLERLGMALVVVARLGEPGDPELARDLVVRAATAYADTIAQLAAGVRIGSVGFGASPLLDEALDKARARGDAHHAVDELAPVENGTRTLAIGDLDPVADDGVIEDRIVAVDPEQADWIDAAIAQWRNGKLDAAAAVVKLRARRIGSGVSSYPVLRFQVVLEGTTAAPDDDLVVELKEQRDGLIVRGVPRLEVAAWSSPAARAVDTQKQLQARPDADVLLGHAELGGLSLKIRDREAYQRGIDAPDLAELAHDAPDQLRALAGIYGALLARAHGVAPTADGMPGHTAIAPLLAGRDAAFAEEIATAAVRDADQLFADYALLGDAELAPFVIPEEP